ncbi:hypothetical protein DPM33_23590 [Mesorhizobium hawassense]|uniref:HK97 family phage prohead protease n=1 Tax=Mesorhizobium hawassense TaxID=1209954 RepID=A0A330HIH8_9HYPH|nr:hypothetical protein [Mesorhizobium hawassense]RAZ88511.1 hypothetical protein DPM33_23590 [Mesorhizobium hawassense]
MHLLAGLASTEDLDKSNNVVRLGALQWGATLPPLLFDHDLDLSKTVGTIHRLEWTTDGLAIAALVEDMYATIKGFSARFRVEDYEIVGQGSRAHAVVKRGTIREISLVDRPCCPGALVLSRQHYDPPPFGAYARAAGLQFDALARAIAALQAAISSVKQEM